MNSTISKDFFALIKHHVETHLDRNGWQWSSQDSLLLDWCVQNMEATHAS